MTENTREVQLKASMDATGVRAGVEQAKTAIQDLGKTAEREGAKAGAGLGKAGDGAGQAATKIDRETRSMIGSIERATAAFKAGQKGGADYFEVLAKQRGVSGDALKPYLDQLRQAEAAQKAAEGSLKGIGVSAAQTAAALRQVPAQFGDIVTSIAGGQKPLQVFLQQGSQIKDAFGGAGAASRALGGYVLGLLNPFSLAAAAGLGLAVAFESGSAEGRAFARTLILTGNAAGATVNQLAQVSAEIAKGGATQGAASEALTQLAATGKVGAENLGRFAAAALELQRVGGPAVEDTVKAFAELGRSPLQASLKLNESTNFLTVSLYEQIRALEQQGRTTEAAKVAQQGFASAMEQRIPALAANLGLLERAWKGVKEAITGAGDALLDIGRRSTVADLQGQLKNAEISAKEAGPAGLVAILAERKVRALRDQVAAAQEVERLAQRSAASAAVQLRQVAARDEAEKLLADLGVKRVSQADQELALRRKLAEAAVDEKTITEAIIALRKKGGESGGDAELASQRARVKEAGAYLATLKEIRATSAFEALGDAKQTESQKRVVDLQERLKASISGVTRAKLEQELAGARQLAAIEVETRDTEEMIKFQQQAQTEYQKLIAQNYSAARSTETQAKQQEELNGQLGKGATAAAKYRLEALEAERAVFLQAELIDAAQLASIQAKIDAQQRFVTALKSADFKAIDTGLDEWLRGANELERLYAEELRLSGLSRLERDKIVAARQVELKLAKELAKIDAADISDAEKERLRIKARVAAEKEASAAVNKVMRDDAARTADEIRQSLTDALMRGFERGKGLAQNLRDTVVNMFKTLVLRPTIEPYINQAAGWLQGALGGGAGGGGFGSLIGGIGSLFNSSWPPSAAAWACRAPRPRRRRRPTRAPACRAPARPSLWGPAPRLSAPTPRSLRSPWARPATPMRRDSTSATCRTPRPGWPRAALRPRP
jgi:phage-related minor tail protein